MSDFNFTSFPNLRTQRLFIREASNEDVEVIFDLRSDKEINKFVGTKRVESIDEAKDFINLCEKLYKNKNRIFWLIEYEDLIIGSVVLHRISLKDKYAEVGYKLKPVFYKKGIMTEALKEILRFGLDKLGLDIIEAYTHKDNIPSIALLKKCNFVFQSERKDKKIQNNRIFKLEKNNFKYH